MEGDEQNKSSHGLLTGSRYKKRKLNMKLAEKDLELFENPINENGEERNYHDILPATVEPLDDILLATAEPLDDPFLSKLTDAECSFPVSYLSHSFSL